MFESMVISHFGATALLPPATSITTYICRAQIPLTLKNIVWYWIGSVNIIE